MPFQGKTTSHTAPGAAIPATDGLLASPLADLIRATAVILGVNINKKGA